MQTTATETTRRQAIRRQATLFGLAALTALGLAAAHPQASLAQTNLVQDGGFEDVDTSSFTGSYQTYGEQGVTDALGNPLPFDNDWTITSGTVGIDHDDNYVHGGSNSLWLNAEGPTGTNTVTQTLDTTQGQSYLFTFYANNNGPEPLTVEFGGVPISDTPGGTTITVPTNGYPPDGDPADPSRFTQYQFLVTASSGLTTLSFSAPGSDPAAQGGYQNTLELDDVSVTASGPVPVPEPSSVAAFAFAGLGAAGLILRARKRRTGA